jgi:hypothetical protein
MIPNDHLISWIININDLNGILDSLEYLVTEQMVRRISVQHNMDLLHMSLHCVDLLTHLHPRLTYKTFIRAFEDTINALYLQQTTTFSEAVSALFLKELNLRLTQSPLTITDVAPDKTVDDS